LKESATTRRRAATCLEFYFGFLGVDRVDRQRPASLPVAQPSAWLRVASWRRHLVHGSLNNQLHLDDGLHQEKELQYKAKK